MANILYHVDSWSGVFNAGSETMNNTMAKYLVAKGHTVHVLTNPRMARNGEIRDGLFFVTDILNNEVIDREYDWADYVVTSIAFTPRVVHLCKEKNKKLIYIIHNNHSVPYWQVKPSDVWMAVYNADWVKKYHHEKLNFKPDLEFTCYPPVLFNEYQCDNDEKEYISLINLSQNKGIMTLVMAARMLPQYKFLAVKGSYGDQVTEGLPKNVILMDHTSNILEDVYRKTKITLMPSKKETWGMVAIESYCSGIPVIAHPTEGLVEACGNAGIFCLRDKAYPWKDTIIKLMEDSEFYNRVSVKCKDRALELSNLAETQLEQWEKLISEDHSMQSPKD